MSLPPTEVDVRVAATSTGGVQSQASVAPQDAPRLGIAGRVAPVEELLEAHLTAVALAILAAGFVLRLWVAARSYLSPDEALIYVIIHQPSLALSYKLSLTEPHPPLFYVLLHFWHLLGRSEWMLRLPSVFAGMGFCWCTYRWLSRLFNKAAGLTGLILAAFLPPVVALSAEMRMYALLLFAIAAALDSLERALETNSRRWMWIFSGALYAAILTHYSAIFFVVSAGVYVLVRMASSRAPRDLILTWAEGQAIAVALYGLLYLTHLSQRKGVVDTWQTPSYFHWGSVSVFAFTRQRTVEIFQFLFQNRYVSVGMLLFFLISLAILFRGALANHRDGRDWPAAVLCVLPFVGVLCAAIAALYPYGGSRHIIFLVPFVIAGLSYLFAAVSGRRLWASFMLAAVLMAVSNASATTPETDIPEKDQRRELMTAAMNQLQQSATGDERIFADYESSFLFAYYFCGPGSFLEPTRMIKGFYRDTCAGHTIIANYAQWKMTASDFPQRFYDLARVQHLKPGDRVWLFQAGWEPDLSVKPTPNSPQFRCLDAASFGNNIRITPFFVGPDLLPVSTIGVCGTARP